MSLSSRSVRRTKDGTGLISVHPRGGIAFIFVTFLSARTLAIHLIDGTVAFEQVAPLELVQQLHRAKNKLGGGRLSLAKC